MSMIDAYELDELQAQAARVPGLLTKITSLTMQIETLELQLDFAIRRHGEVVKERNALSAELQEYKTTNQYDEQKTRENHYSEEQTLEQRRETERSRVSSRSRLFGTEVPQRCIGNEIITPEVEY